MHLICPEGSKVTNLPWGFQRPLTSEGGKKSKGLEDFFLQAKPESCLDCLICAIFALQCIQKVRQEKIVLIAHLIPKRQIPHNYVFHPQNR